MLMKQKVAVIGALNAIGRGILDCLAARGFLPEDIFALDSSQNTGVQIPYQDYHIRVENLETFDFSQTKVVFLCTLSILEEYPERILGYGQYLIDCVGILGEGICLIPALQSRGIKRYRVIENPTSMTVVLAQVLKPVQKEFGIRSVLVTALLSAGEFGQDSVQALVNQTRSLYTREPLVDGPFKKTQAFNLVPEIYPTLSRRTGEQLKGMLHLPIQIATCLTPIFQGQCYFLTITTKEKCTCADLEQVFEGHPVCRIITGMDPYLTLSTQDTACNDEICLTLFRQIPHLPNTCGFWIVCDNIRLGSALNAVRIAEHILS